MGPAIRRNKCGHSGLWSHKTDTIDAETCYGCLRGKNKWKTWASVFWEGLGQNRDWHVLWRFLTEAKLSFWILVNLYKGKKSTTWTCLTLVNTRMRSQQTKRLANPSKGIPPLTSRGGSSWPSCDVRAEAHVVRFPCPMLQCRRGTWLKEICCSSSSLWYWWSWCWKSHSRGNLDLYCIK